MIELNKQEVCVGEQSVIAFSQAYCEGDIIVPDSKPDIAKILQVSANVVISNKRCAQDRITVDGRCDINILYVSEHGSVCSIVTTQSFSDIIDAKGVTENMVAELEADLQNIDYNIINSRKLNLKMLIAIDANASIPVNCELCVGIAQDCDAEVLKKVVRPYNNVYKGYEQITLKENLELPAGKPDIDTIVKSEIRMCITEVKPVNDKIIVNGRGNVTVLYLDCNDASVLQFAEFELPFSEVVEAPGTSDDMTVNVKIKCEQLYTEPCCDSDGDNRRISIEVLAGLSFKVFCETELEIIEDTYCTGCRLNAKTESAVIDRLVTCNKTQVTLKDNVTLPTDINKICSVYAKPNISNTSIENNKVHIEGVMDTDILYVPEDDSMPICSYRHLHKFSQYIECDGINDTMLCDVNVTVEHISFNITMSNEVEIRIIATIDTRIIEKTKVEYVSNLEMCEDEEENTNNCCIKVYFVQPKDRLWDIAKTYRTTVDKILEDNDLSCESDICEGKRLIIS